jgi:hypothetical protein
VIRQAISCDICGTEKKLTNHWYLAYDQGGELRVSGLESRNRLRPGAKHLCGQTCLHKLVDDFITRAQEVRPQSGAAEMAEVELPVAVTDTSLTSNAAHGQTEPTVRELTMLVPLSPKRTPFIAHPGVVAMPGRIQQAAEKPGPDGGGGFNPRLKPTESTLASAPEGRHTSISPPIPSFSVAGKADGPSPMPGEPSRFASRNWRAEAWERERERELRAAERHPVKAARRRSG